MLPYWTLKFFFCSQWISSVEKYQNVLTGGLCFWMEVFHVDIFLFRDKSSRAEVLILTHLLNFHHSTYSMSHEMAFWCFILTKISISIDASSIKMVNLSCYCATKQSIYMDFDVLTKSHKKKESNVCTKLYSNSLTNKPMRWEWKRKIQ